MLFRKSSEAGCPTWVLRQPSMAFASAARLPAFSSAAIASSRPPTRAGARGDRGGVEVGCFLGERQQAQGFIRTAFERGELRIQNLFACLERGVEPGEVDAARLRSEARTSELQ